MLGVSISTLTGENGILNQATNAKLQTDEATLEEQRQMTIAEANMNFEKKLYTDKNGKTATIPAGFAVSQVEGENTIDDGLVIIDKYGDEFVWIPVLNESDYIRRSGTINRHLSANTANDSNKDITQYILGDNLKLNSILGQEIKEIYRSGNTAANIPEKEIVTSSKGFYVSRYEIGIKERKTDSNGNQGNIDWINENLVSQSGKEPVRFISQTTAIQLINNWKTGNDIQSGLITGTAWDTMCNFIGWDIADGDCTNWGNYRNNLSKKYSNIYTSPCFSGAWEMKFNWQRTSDDDNERKIFPTGKFINQDGTTTKIKNIYDIAGNVTEWTTEIPIHNQGHRIARGRFCAFLW